MKVIDLSGLGHSGKTAVTDLLREIDGIHAHHNLFEFDLMRLPDGIIDLNKSLCGNWSPIRSDMAIKRFRKLCEALKIHYSDNLNEQFMDYTDEYLDSLVMDSLYIKGWFDSLYEDSSKQYKVKLFLKKVGIFHSIKFIYKLFKTNFNNNEETEVFLSDGHDFVNKTKIYLEKILLSNLNNDVNTLVINNGFEPFNPSISMHYFENPYCVIVDRDPRDIYTSIIKSELTFLPEWEKDAKDYMNKLKEDFLGTANIQTFITRQRLYREKIQKKNDDSRIIYVNYEELVTNYKESVENLLSNLNIDPILHNNKFQFFDPKLSIKNVGIWKKIKNTKEIKLIEAELEQYLYKN